MTKINILNKFRIGGVTQSVLLRGSNTRKPVLLLIQAGPGFPMISEAEAMQNALRLEDNFVVAYWDQRGCGISYNKDIQAESMNLEQMVSDTLELTKIIRNLLKVKKIFLVGFSLGGTIGALVASRYPEYYFAYMGVGIDVHMGEAELTAYNFTLEQAVKKQNKKALKELKAIGTPPHVTTKKFITRVKWLTNFGGVNTQETFNSLTLKTLKNMLFSKDYSLLDILKALKGMSFSQKNLLNDLISLDLFEMVDSIKIPTFLIHGNYDYASPLTLVEIFYKKLEVPQGKYFIIFENSAHMPYYEEPNKFNQTLLEMVNKAKVTSC